MKKVELSSDFPFRWRLVGLDAWNQVSAGAIEVVFVADGSSIELGSVVDNGTLKISGDVGEINILASKIVNLVASFSKMRNVGSIEINSDSEVTDEEKMINKTRIVDDLFIRFTSDNVNTRYYFADVQNVDRELQLNEKDGYSKLNLVSLAVSDKFPIHDNIKEISSNKLDLRKVKCIKSLDGGVIQALDKFDVATRDGRILPALYNEVFSEPIDASKTIEMDFWVNSRGDYIFRDGYDNISFDNPDDNKTLEIDLSVNNLGDTIYRNIDASTSFDNPDGDKTLEMSLSVNNLGDTIYRDRFDDSSVLNNTSDTINYTFEMDLYAQGALTDVDGNTFSADNPMDLTQLPA